MNKYRISALLIILASILVGFFVYTTQTNQKSKFPFRLGLDLSGGVRLTYKADTSKLQNGDVGSAMETLREVVERRVNLFGVTEPIVQVENGGVFASGETENRLIIELPGVTDVKKAVEMIGKTPELDFKLVRPEAQGKTADELKASTTNEVFVDTGLTGRLLDKAQVVFSQSTNQAVVSITFNDEGKKLFADITEKNVGKPLAIFLDGQLKSSPVINEPIRDGKAQISGGFTPVQAKELARDLNYGALPVPIDLIETQSIGPSLGEKVLSAGVFAGLIGFILVALFLICIYRLPGLIASVALVIYVCINLSLYKLIPVTITAAGIAGFILSMGIAVDANILMFSRMREEFKRGKNLQDSLTEGFSRAWTSIRDGNTSAIIIALILFWTGTSLIKGFALTLILGVLVSLLTAATITRIFLLAIAPKSESKLVKGLFGLKK